ncbi:myo-inositol-1(or 4)-monophosphatase [Microlunatus sagamiharensis]|uniref:Histidinol-phosphatase n=1 Tax=Microlunatus sagamiharensis TaxID=546874 RepID=A0A1H2LZL9_9ACTN|nr:inositol monophosphatase [Microlunatus sagamiharensis]SDU85726.1 myo-inositol-1(or 4)-monophosphatase [Microlunatus sagamiharensis]
MTDPTTETGETWLQERARVAEEIIRDAGAVALGYFDRLAELTVRSKGVQDVVSEADVAVEHLVKERLAQAFPHDAFLGEETGHADFPGSEGIWVVDPIDGTQPFVSGLRTWCVSVAYVRDGATVLGLVLNPAAGELFVGATDRPATLNGTEIHPSPATSVSEGLTFLGCSSRVGPEDVVPVLDRLMRAHGMFVRNGSGALGLCDVACGRLVGYVEPHINAWDCLGAVAVLEAAGARVSDYLTPETLLAGNKIIAATPAAYDELVSILG